MFKLKFYYYYQREGRCAEMDKQAIINEHGAWLVRNPQVQVVEIKDEIMTIASQTVMVFIIVYEGEDG